MSQASQSQPPGPHWRKISFADVERTFRAAGPMVPPPPHSAAQPALNAAQVQAQRLEELRRQDTARRISQKPTDRDIPEELGDVVVGDGVQRYAQLRDVERKLDAVVMRKRLDISDNLQRRYTRREGVLRVWVSNTAEGQPWQVVEDGSGVNEDGTFEFGENSQATFRVKIEGRLLEDAAEDEKHEEGDKEKEREGEAETKRPPQQRPRFSHFFKAITIDFSRNPQLQPDGYSAIEWHKPQPGPQNPSYDPNSSDVSFDTLEFERKSDENINVTIKLVRDEKNERFRLSPQLAEILDTEEEDRAGAVQGVWEYCRAMGLQEDEDKRSIVCDEPLRKLFGQDKLYFPYVPDLLHPHLHPLPPIQLHYTIRVDKAYIKGSDNPTTTITQPSAPTVYDLRIPLPNPLMHQLTRFHTSKSHLATLQTLVKTDDDLALLAQHIHATNAKRKFHDNLAKDPASFVKRWISSQQRDLEVVLAEATRGGGGAAAGGEDGQAAGSVGEGFRRGGAEGVWGGKGARESVGLWLARNSKGV
ncbi:hypothetical protein LTR36_005725 [Oleoguttula mirabilis]|uniref:DM2 domain-containing protein n=1 Tax=Oleoguttula mirabilis TaxID=1507867 RepID=A0AAV9JD28_9PEZI|nr:hypothetical protein LTR36_005725 [Oleoguttula mirabilis]